MNIKRIICTFLVATLVATLALTLAACTNDASGVPTGTTTVTQADTPTGIAPTETGTTVSEETQPAVRQVSVEVYDAYTDSVEMYGDTCTYAIPGVNADGKPLEKVNAAIWNDIYEGVYQPYVRQPYDDYGEADVGVISYEWNCYNGYLTVITRYKDYFTDGGIHNVYNIDPLRDEFVSNEELLTAYGMTEDDFYDAAYNVLCGKFWDDNEGYREFFADDEEAMNRMYQLLHDTVSSDNVKKCIPIVGEGGRLGMLGYICSDGQMDKYETVLTMDYNISPEALEALEHKVG